MSLHDDSGGGCCEAMKVRFMHAWELRPREAMALQERLSRGLVLRGKVRRPRLVAGCDAAYLSDGQGILGGVVIWDLEEALVVEHALVQGQVGFPYIPGLLGFREVPILLEALSRLTREPELVLVDGQGTAHPRGLGSASHLGLHVDVPTVGCAKSKLVGTHEPLGRPKGEFRWLFHNGRRVGAVVRTREGVRPLYVSPGNRIGLKGAIEVVLQCLGRFRVPEPLRRAHMLVQASKRKEISGG